MKAEQTALPGVLLLSPVVHGDDRGFFLERFNKREFSKVTGLEPDFVQDNHSRSRRNVLRGLHYQMVQPQGKLVWAVTGKIFDVAVDLRAGSATFGRSAGMLLSDENRKVAWIPPGFAHGFLVLSEYADILYKATDYYAPAHERVLLWNDPSLGIDWPLEADSEPILAEKDRTGKPLAAAERYESAGIGG